MSLNPPTWLGSSSVQFSGMSTSVLCPSRYGSRFDGVIGSSGPVRATSKRPVAVSKAARSAGVRLSAAVSVIVSESMRRVTSSVIARALGDRATISLYASCRSRSWPDSSGWRMPNVNGISNSDHSSVGAATISLLYWPIDSASVTNARSEAPEQ